MKNKSRRKDISRLPLSAGRSPGAARAPSCKRPHIRTTPLPYILHTDTHRKAMLDKVGVPSIDELFKMVPDAFHLKRPLAVPDALPEMELQQHMGELAARNIAPGDAVCFLGGGSYDHFIPSVVDAVASRSEYY